MTDTAGPVPARRPGVVVKQRGHETRLRGPEGEWLALNDTALALWELCDGFTSVDEMVRAMSLFFDADEQVIRNDVRASLDELVEQGFIIWASQVPGR